MKEKNRCKLLREPSGILLLKIFVSTTYFAHLPWPFTRLVLRYSHTSSQNYFGQALTRSTICLTESVESGQSWKLLCAWYYVSYQMQISFLCIFNLQFQLHLCAGGKESCSHHLGTICRWKLAYHIQSLQGQLFHATVRTAGYQLLTFAHSMQHLFFNPQYITLSSF